MAACDRAKTKPKVKKTAPHMADSHRYKIYGYALSQKTWVKPGRQLEPVELTELRRYRAGFAFAPLRLTGPNRMKN